jgi:hypothetical protein
MTSLNDLRRRHGPFRSVNVVKTSASDHCVRRGIAARGVQSVLIPLGLPCETVKRGAKPKIYGCTGGKHDARCKRVAPNIGERFAP